MNNGAHVLIVSRDQMLLQTRSLLLGAYFQVEPAGRVPEAELAFSRAAFDLVVLCYSLSDDEYLKMIELCKLQEPQPKILILNPASGAHHRRGVDGEYSVESGPYELMRKAAEVLGVPLKTMGRASHV
jgi:DNA-binding response OmpR family regulator